MKLSTVLIGAASLFGIVCADDENENKNVNMADPAASDVDGEFLDVEEPVPFLYNINYTISGKPESSVLELFNGEEISLDYAFTNNEEEDVTVVGVGGNFGNPLTSENVANITDAKLGPVIIAPGETKKFQQRIGVNLAANNYILRPGLYVVKGTSLALLAARTQLVVVDDAPISFLNPQLVILELLLVGTLAAGCYVAWINFGRDYFKSSQTLSGSKSESHSSANAATKNDKDFVESWLPESHLKKVNKKKNK